MNLNSMQRWGIQTFLGSLLCLGLFVTFARCSPTPEKRACSSVADCIGEEICAEGFCKEQVKCSSAADCLGTEQCIQGICTQETTSKETDSRDGSVAPERKIKPDTHQSGCTKNSECTAPKVCQQGQCVKPISPECQKDGDCKSGEQCSQGKCIPKSAPGCKVDTDCKTGQVCTQKRCVPCQSACKVGAKQCSGKGFVSCVSVRGCGTWGTQVQACGAGTSCKAGACVSGCSTDSDCKDGKVCHKGECTKWCFANSECSTGYRCIDQKCAVSCTSNTQCMHPYGFTCEAGQCKKTFIPCSSSSQCPGGYLCGPQKRCTNRCSSSFDCKKLYYCDSGACKVSKTCSGATAHTCPYGLACSSRSNGQCYTKCYSKDSYRCRDNLQCDTKIGRCEPKECTKQSDCRFDLACVNGRCKISCKVDTDCRANYRCDAGKCKEGCTNDSNCSGYLCDTKSAKECYEKCNSTKDCATGFACNASHQCVPKCTKDSDCKNGDLCVREACHKKNYRRPKYNEPCDRAATCASGYECVDIGTGGSYFVCREKCSRTWDCATNGQEGCLSVKSLAGTTSKVCFSYCGRGYNAICGDTYTCTYKTCRKRVSAGTGNRKLYSPCFDHNSCEKDLQCTDVNRGTSWWDVTKICLNKCSASNSCASGYTCRGDGGSYSQYRQSCYKKCSTSTDCKGISSVRLSCYKGLCVDY